MSQEPQSTQGPQERAHVSDKNPLSYSKWDDLDFESDEDDCHPNIEIGTWRRLKERMRREKGIKKKEPHLVDKWNVTTTNKNYEIDPQKPPSTTEEQKGQSQNTSPNLTENTANTENTENTKNTENIQNKSESSTVPTQILPKTSDTKPTKSESNPIPDTSETNANAVVQPTETNPNDADDFEPYKARSNPQTFLDTNLSKLKKFSLIKKDSKADKFVMKHPELVHEAAEGYLITYAVDRAVEGAEKPELARLSRRTLMVHNLVQSCSQQNVSPQIGVERFYSKVGKDAKLTESYKTELNKQVKELMERIESRRVERLAELQDIPEEYTEEEKAPLGPGGLDPTEVLNSLPKEMQDAFVGQDIESLKGCLAAMDKDMAEYHMRRCVDAGLWVQPNEEPEQEQQQQQQESVQIDQMD